MEWLNLIIGVIVLWYVIKFFIWVLKPTYKDKLTKIKGVGSKLADDIISQYLEEDDLKSLC